MAPVVVFLLPLVWVVVCMCAACRTLGGHADVNSGKATASYVAFRGLAGQSWGKLCSARRSYCVALSGDSAFWRGFRCVLAMRMSCGAGEMPRVRVLREGREIPPRFDAWIVCVASTSVDADPKSAATSMDANPVLTASDLDVCLPDQMHLQIRKCLQICRPLIRKPFPNGTQTRSHEKLLSYGWLEDRKKVLPNFSRTVDNATGIGDATGRRILKS
ncbi:hypothetical protein Taro_030427 [Colocasia esculenta]|uniref:Secreted protein n=1 Tax=Colocasia esculenta TaxID=4460 RepID=A0A843VW39_COLES|nr:hypothetical protein [Colocasia esculenta]